MSSDPSMGMTPTFRVGEIGQIALTVGDLRQAREFYQNTLGIPFLFDAGTMAFLQCGAIRLMIGVAEHPGAATGDRGTILYFRTSDIGTAYRELLGKGVRFIREPHLVAKMPDHELWMSFFEDPDGNRLALMSEVR